MGCHLLGNVTVLGHDSVLGMRCDAPLTLGDDCFLVCVFTPKITTTDAARKKYEVQTLYSVLLGTPICRLPQENICLPGEARSVLRFFAEVL